MTRISTHVLDTALGVPARDMSVHLERRVDSGEWRVLASARTDQNGRCEQLIPEGEPVPPGVYRLAFDTAGYHSRHEQHGLYPTVLVTFSVRSGETHFHLPLLLSPHGYTTYRGT
jgi:5-hydroxyisourate hydrolase